MSTTQDCINKIILKKFGCNFNPKKKYIIAIQGATSSGKTTIATQLHDTLSSHGIKSFIIGLDSFYKTFDTSTQDNYDFDNPAAYDWIKLQKVLVSIINDEDTIPMVKRDKYINEKQEIECMDNPHPQVIIIEGIYSFNSINKYIFNIDEYDVRNSSKPLEMEYIKGSNILGNTRILKVFLPMCRNKLKSIRLSRDLKIGRTKNEILERFNMMIWPDTLRWVNSSLESSDIQIIHGNFNYRKISDLLNSLSEYFCGSEYTISKEKKDDDFFKEFMVSCSGECLSNQNSYLILEDK